MGGQRHVGSTEERGGVAYEGHDVVDEVLLSKHREILIEEYLHEQVVAEISKRKHDHVRVDRSVSSQALWIKHEHPKRPVTLGKYSHNDEERRDHVVDVAVDEDHGVVTFLWCLWPEKCGTQQVLERKVSHPIQRHEKREGHSKRNLVFEYRVFWYLEDVLLIDVSPAERVVPIVLEALHI